MLTIYPSNRLEDLVQLLRAVLAQRRGNILTPDTILVESKGMQHWLNLQLATMQGVSMNLQFQMPSSFIWDLARKLLGADHVPVQSPYRREVLSWRIDALMAHPDFLDSETCAEVSRYWSGNTEHPDHLKRFQLATRLADLFEQYMLFRPDWLNNWEHGKTVLENSATEPWQAWLWRCLVEEHPGHPVSLQRQSIRMMAEYPDKLPEHVLIFAINTLAPQTLEFFNVLSEHSHVHLFHLNPCVEFWGEIQSDKAQARHIREQQLSAWIDKDELETSNPLLANLGQQGKEFFNLLQGINGFEISAFNEDSGVVHASADTLLSSIQRDILTLHDNRNNKHNQTPKDDSVVFSSCHSALREIQTLHDYLLHQFEQDTELKPRDVLVMCPAIEEYASYIDAVFRHPWEQTEDPDSPRLPCSIADRTLMDSEPLIGAFVELLQLPDSRFEISKILDFVRLPALQAKFGFSAKELETLEWWLEISAVHWGLDADHKQKLLEMQQEATPMFTWCWGLERLLLGFAQSDAEQIKDGRLLLPHVEGQEILLLGRLMQLLERLQHHARELLKSRTPVEWQIYLTELSDSFFLVQVSEQDAGELIHQVINTLADYTGQAGYDNKVELAVIRNYLQHRFGQPDSGNHFLTGQITFCSMIPMRSIPFKVIAILGLNDGQFPRQNIPPGFDLIAQHPRRQGDRSRRGDDRYLFLEALISARQKLYLSYQGRDIRKNSQREPSLILKELMNYLEQSYGWNLLQQVLHPFSRDNYLGAQPSFDASWLRVTHVLKARNNRIELPEMELPDEPVRIDEMVSFFDNPLQEFAHKRLNLYLRNESLQLEDAEPFIADKLTEYQIRSEFCQALLKNDDIGAVRLRYQLSGELPESPVTRVHLDNWEQEAAVFSDAVLERGQVDNKRIEVTVTNITVSAELSWLKEGQTVLVWRPASRKPKDDIRLWLMHLVATVYVESPVSTQGLYLMFNKHKQEWQVKTVVLPPEISVAQAKEYLSLWLQVWRDGLCQPLLVHGKLARELLEKDSDKSFNDLVYEAQQKMRWRQIIEGNYNQPGLADDAYFRWFYPITPTLNPEQHETLYKLYQPLYQRLKV